MELTKPLIAPEPPTAEEMDKERRQSRLKKLGAPLFHSVPTRTKVAVGVVYLSLATLLIAGVAETYVPQTV